MGNRLAPITLRESPRGRFSWGGALVLAVVVIAGVGGCGNSRTPVPSVYRSIRPFGFHPFVLPQYGFGLVVPKNWSDLANQVRAPVVMIVASGAAVVAISRYARALPPPADAASLEQARIGLLAAIRARQPRFRLLGSRRLAVEGQPAVQVDGIEPIDGHRRRVRSLHVYTGTGELVLEEYAPVRSFPAVDRQVFTRVSRSLRLLRPRP